MTDSARLNITLLDLQPGPWRRIEVPLSLTLKGLHDAIQAAFQWFDAHLWEFEFGGRRYGPSAASGFGFVDPADKVHKASGFRLTALRESPVREFLYVYDMGDGWQHLIEVEALFEAEAGARLPRYLAGEWAAPPEDCGGPPGFERFLEVMADPKHPEHDELLDWHDGPFDPAFVDEEQIRLEFLRQARRRRPKA